MANRVPTGAIIIQAWKERGSKEDILVEIIDTVLSHERRTRDLYREHVDLDQAAKNKLVELSSKFEAGTLKRADIAVPAPGKTPEPIETIDAEQAKSLEDLLGR